MTDDRRPQELPDSEECRPLANLTQVVAYNFRTARKLRGWTQIEAAERLAPFLGYRPTQAGISVIECAHDGGRPCRFDVRKLVAFTLAFDLPLVWFLLPPPLDPRVPGNATGVGLHPTVLGSGRDVAPFFGRLRELDAARPGPSPAETASDPIGAGPQAWARSRPREMLGAWCGEHADELLSAAEQMGRVLDDIRDIGLRASMIETLGEVPERCSVPPVAERRDGWALLDGPVATPSDGPVDPLALLEQRFSVELSAWDVDMVVRGLICWSRDPLWEEVDRGGAECLPEDLRELEQRLQASVPPEIGSLYEQYLLTGLSEDRGPGAPDGDAGQ